MGVFAAQPRSTHAVPIFAASAAEQPVEVAHGQVDLFPLGNTVVVPAVLHIGAHLRIRAEVRKCRIAANPQLRPSAGKVVRKARFPGRIVIDQLAKEIIAERHAADQALHLLRNILRHRGIVSIHAPLNIVFQHRAAGTQPIQLRFLIALDGICQHLTLGEHELTFSRGALKIEPCIALLHRRRAAEALIFCRVQQRKDRLDLLRRHAVLLAAVCLPHLDADARDLPARGAEQRLRIDVRPRIRQKAHGHDHDREHRRGGDPKRGLFVVQRAFHARFDVPLAECQRAGRDSSSRRGAGQQRLRIVRARRTVQPLDDFFIARELDVAAEEDVGDPHQRVEPVQREHEVAQHLPPVVAAGEVRVLVRDDIRRRPLVHVHGKINVRLHHAEDERRIDKFALVDVISQQNRRCELSFQLSRAHERVDEQRRHAGKPEDAVDVEVHLRLLAAHADGDLRRRRQRRIRDDVKRRLLVEHRLARFGHDLARDGLGARDERERAFNRKQADKPQCDHTPEKRHDPLRRFFEDNPQHEHRQNEPACADAEVHELQKDVIHDDSPFGKGRSFSAPRQALCRSRGSTL